MRYACLLAIVAAVLGGGAAPGSGVALRRTLPAPRRTGGPSLAEVLATRRSVRAFAARPLDDAELGQLLWAAQGITGGHRTAPSAGALYPLSVRVIDARGVWRYEPADHALVLEAPGDRRAALSAAALGQTVVGSAPAILVISARFAITARRYGARAERFATLEAGHVAQNVLLEATALGLGAVPIGAFDDAALRRVLGVGRDVVPLYLIPVGARP